MCNIHVVHSVKGGCGKSAYSLMLGLFYSEIKAGIEYDDAITNKRKVIYIDADFRGSATKSLFYNISNENSGKPKYLHYNTKKFTDITGATSALILADNDRKYCINDVIKKRKSLSDIRQTLCFSWKSSTVPSYQVSVLDMVFSNPLKDEKKLFTYHTDQENYNPIDVGIFEASFKKFMKNVLKEKYENIIIDLPPSNDEYSASLFNTLRELKGKHKLYLHLIVTGDLAHRFTTLEYLSDILPGHSVLEHLDKVVIIRNHICNNDSESVDLFKAEVENRLQQLRLIDQINYFAFADNYFQESYYKFTHEMMTNEIEIFELKDSLISLLQGLDGGNKSV
ncbi:hypothetical protein [Longicatena caecimuris]|uniref:hypothetical protein n=1 Tax=Longicatena caecimuris TaxID=1796635 RepID=UPI0018A8FE92|nr:hypothetical protein [Longicatena caecimuris]